MNARTNKLKDFVSNDGSNHNQDTSDNSFQPLERQNFDSIANNHGKKIIEICKNTDMRILNGRTIGDSVGRPTFHGKNGTSLVDYIICDQKLIPKVKHLVVKSPIYLSDHSQVITWINLFKTTFRECSFNITRGGVKISYCLQDFFRSPSQHCAEICEPPL